MAIPTCKGYFPYSRSSLTDETDEDRVRSIHMNPANDTFVSAGDDRTVRLWDLRSQNCQVSLSSVSHLLQREADVEQGLSQDIGGSAIVAFDNTGMAFAIACSQTQTVALYNTAEIDHVSISSSVTLMRPRC